jgi:hypothetical protein
VKHRYLVVADITKSLSVNKKAAQKFDVERFSLNNLSWKLRNRIRLNSEKGLQLWELKNLSEDINRVWETIQNNVKISAKWSLGRYEEKQQKPWYDEKCSQFLDQRKQAKMQWLQNQTEVM